MNEIEIKLFFYQFKHEDIIQLHTNFFTIRANITTNIWMQPASVFLL